MVEQTVQPVQVAPGGGDTVFFVGDTYTTLLSGAQTGGTFAMLEALVPAHTGPPPHIHHAEDETFILLDGVIDFMSQMTCTEPSPAAWSSSRGERSITSAMPATASRACCLCTPPPGWKACSRRSARPEPAGCRRPRFRQAIWRRSLGWRTSTGSRLSPIDPADSSVAGAAGPPCDCVLANSGQRFLIAEDCRVLREGAVPCGLGTHAAMRATQKPAWALREGDELARSPVTSPPRLRCWRWSWSSDLP